MPKNRFVAQKLWPVACEHREVLTTEYPIRASAFQASACDLSGPINNVSKRVMKYTHYTLSDPDSVTRLAVKGKHTYLSSRPE